MSVELVNRTPAPQTSRGFLVKLRRAGHYALKLATLGVIALVAVLAIGFFRFTDRIANLPTPAPTASYEAIIALTGGYQRIDKAIELLRKGMGARLLISGVNPSTSPEALKKATGASDEMFACCVDIGYQAIDTIGNANEAANWIRKNSYRKVLVVTNNYHIPRSLMELASASPDVEFVGYPVILSDMRSEEWMTDPVAVRTLVTEYFKYALARLRSVVGHHDWDGLRAKMPEAGPTVVAASFAE